MEKEEKEKEGRIIFLFCFSFLPHRLPPGKNEKKNFFFLKPRTQLDYWVETEKEHG